MEIALSTLIIISCILLVIIVLVQNPKGGGLSSSFGGSGTQLFGGVKKTTDFLDRGTWALAIVLVVLVLFANVSLDPNIGGDSVENQESVIENAPVSQPAPIMNNLELPAQEIESSGSGEEGAEE